MRKKTTNKLEMLVCGETYHIFNKAVGSEKLYKTQTDYIHFLNKLDRYIKPIANIYAYCLIPNHFHLLLKIMEPDEIDGLRRIHEEDYSKYFSHVFGIFFNSYAKSFNKAYKRNGRLFIQPYKRILVQDDDYFAWLVNYIHRNPIHHGLVNEMWEWKYSSYNILISAKSTSLDRDEVLSFFGTIKDFVLFHEMNKYKPGNEEFYLE